MALVERCALVLADLPIRLELLNVDSSVGKATIYVSCSSGVLADLSPQAAGSLLREIENGQAIFMATIHRDQATVQVMKQEAPVVRVHKSRGEVVLREVQNTI